MENFTNNELADMHLIYGETRGNARQAERLYRERFPDRRHPCRQTFTAIDRRLREQGTFVVYKGDCGVRRRTRTVEFEEQVLDRIAEQPSTSTRAIAHEMNCSTFSVWQVLKEQLLHPYHLQKVQGLGPADFPLRINCCQWFLQRLEENPLF